MTITSQLSLVLLESITSLKDMRRKTLLWFSIYYGLGLIIFGLLVWHLVENQAAIKNSLLDYLFPKSWQGISEFLADFLFESQAKVVIGNLVISGSLVLASIFLFPIKEKLSQVFEVESERHTGSYQEFSLLEQGIEESKLLLFYFSVQLFVLWIGYYPYFWTTWFSIILSYLFLFFTFGLDFIAPTLQRHRFKYAVILKALARNPVTPLIFGIIFSLPIIILTRLIFADNENTFIESIAIVLISNLLLLALAVPTGTTIACKIMPLISNTNPPSKKSMVRFYSALFLILLFCLFLHSQLILSLHHKSQLLKAEYDIDWSTMEYDLPSFTQLTQGNAFSNLNFEMVVTNPTEFDINVENSQLMITQNESDIATINLSPFTLPAGETRKIKVDLGSNTNFNNLSEFMGLMDGWKVNMKIDVWPGIPLVFNLTKPEN